MLPLAYPTQEEERPQKAIDVSPCQGFKEGSACAAERQEDNPGTCGVIKAK